MSSEVEGSLVKKHFISKLTNNYNLNTKTINFEIDSLRFGKLNNYDSMSLRVSPHVYGVGLLEAIEESDILKSDKNDLDKDGISGMARMIRNKLVKNALKIRNKSVYSEPYCTEGVAFMHDMVFQTQWETHSEIEKTKGLL